jgi:putative phage-type endonuclease
VKTHTFDTIEDWLAARQEIGGIPISSTDAPAIVGVSKFKSAFALYHEKRQGVRDVGPRYAEMAQWGRELEDVIARRYCLNTGRAIERTGEGKFTIQQSDDMEWMIASVDRYAIVTEQPPAADEADAGDEDEDSDGEPPADRVLAPVGVKIVLELKNAHFATRDRWASETEPPIEYLVQLQHQFAVTGAPWGSLAALIGGVEFRWADVQRNDGFIAMLVEKEQEFRERVERGDPPDPDGSESTMRVLKQLYPDDNGQSIELPPEAIEWANELEQAKADEKNAKDRKKESSNRIKAAIGENTMGVLRDGRVFTYKKQARKETIQRATEFRVLRSRKA